MLHELMCKCDISYLLRSIVSVIVFILTMFSLNTKYV